MAFRNIPMEKQAWKFLILKAQHPVNKKWYYFVDKCMPFGSSISCKHFQDFSDAVAFLVKFRTHKDTVNYLDDYMFAALLKIWCDWQLQQFLDVCSEINFPVSLEKTVWGTRWMTFLGLLLDTVKQVICIPKEKVDRAINLIGAILNKYHAGGRKATVIELQKLTGFLNFLCKCIVPGRAFLTRLYACIASNLKPHHHIRINAEMKSDLEMWLHF